MKRSNKQLISRMLSIYFVEIYSPSACYNTFSFSNAIGHEYVIHKINILLVAAVFLAMRSNASDKAVESPPFPILSIEELLQVEVITASKVSESWAKSLSSVSVITADELHRTGARTVFDALATIPGFNVNYNSRNIAVLEVRGIRKATGSDNILFLLNGHSMNGVVSSAATNTAMFDMPVNNIKRIEVVRGPGSALYGTTALIGVVNIITQEADDIDATKLSISHEIDSEGNIGQQYNILVADNVNNETGYTLNLAVFDFYGDERFIESDLVGRSGLANSSHETVDLQAMLKTGDIRISTNYHQHERDAYLGFTNVLSSGSVEKVEHAFINAEINLKPAKNLEMSLIGYFDYRDVDWLLEFFPAGSVPTGSLSPWNDIGYISDLLWKSTKMGGDITVFYSGVEAHTIVAGIVGEKQKSYDIRHIATYNPGVLTVLQDVSEVFNWNTPATRRLYALYLEDLYDISDKVRTSIGGRYDHYSDFGGTFNPRLSAALEFAKGWDIKFTYGTAFRAPDFGDRFAKNLGGESGNPKAKPEEIKSYEVSISGGLSKAINGRFTYFENDLTNLLAFPQGEDVIKNLGETKTDGVEVELRYDYSRGMYLKFNSTYTDSNDENGQRSADIPLRKANIESNWLINESLNLNLNAHMQSSTPRSQSDSRRAMPGYAAINTTLTAYRLLNIFNVEFSIYNLFDRNYTYVAPVSTVPGDYPAPGRSFLIEIEYRD